jgi:predicted AlkP superfamily pyrophosphatase or phosphodiesterase
MKRKLSLLFLGILIIKAPAFSQFTKHVVLISIDGFRPEFYLDASWPAPVMQQLKAGGVYAQKVKSVFPSFTYPSHVAMLTGALPARSGIYYNAPFEPEGSSGKWNWFIKDIKAPTLWSSIKAAGMTSAAVEWPVSVGEEITWNIPEIWDTKNPSDRITETRKYATKGLIEEIELNATGKLDGENMNEEYVSLDENAGRMAAYIFKTYKPSLLALHFACVDGAQHEQGRDGEKVKLAVATADRAIGNVLEAIERAKLKDSTTVIITGDHGFMNMQQVLRPNIWLKQANLLGEGKSWKVKFQPAGGSAFLYVQNPKDEETISKVQQLLKQLPAEIQKYFTVYDRRKLDAMGADSNAVLALAAAPGTVFSGGVDGDVLSPIKGGGHHGYDTDMAEMYTGFIGFGAGFTKGMVAPSMSVKDMAPLIARLLGLPFKAPDGALVPGLVAVKP